MQQVHILVHVMKVLRFRTKVLHLVIVTHTHQDTVAMSNRAQVHDRGQPQHLSVIIIFPMIVNRVRHVRPVQNQRLVRQIKFIIPVAPGRLYGPDVLDNKSVTVRLQK